MPRAVTKFAALTVPLLAACATALAGPPDAAPACDLPGELELEVTKVIDGDTFLVADGRRVRLSGALAPAAPAGTTAETWLPAVQAKRHLAALVEGRTVVLATGGDVKTDRWGRLLAQVYVGGLSPKPRRQLPDPARHQENDGGATSQSLRAPPAAKADEFEAAGAAAPQSAPMTLADPGQVPTSSPDGGMRQWVQGEMLAAGHARAYALPGRTACLAALTAREQVARDARQGLWQHAAYAVLDAGNPSEILRHRAELVLVQGRVMSVTERGRRLYIDFGPRWQDDFTVVVPPRVLRAADQSEASDADNERPASVPDAGNGRTGATESKSQPSDPTASRRESGISRSSLRSLAGHYVRVRGWIDYRNGPSIELATPEQVELAE